MKEKTLLIIILSIVLTGVLVTMAVLMIMGNGIPIGNSDGTAVEIKTVIVPGDNKYQTNLKGTRSIISLNFQTEILEDKELLYTMEQRKPEARSKVLDILRDKTVEDTKGTEGKKALEREILNCYRALYGDTSIINIYIDDIVVH